MGSLQCQYKRLVRFMGKLKPRCQLEECHVLQEGARVSPRLVAPLVLSCWLGEAVKPMAFQQIG